MRKIPTLYVRDPETKLRYVRNEAKIKAKDFPS